MSNIFSQEDKERTEDNGHIMPPKGSRFLAPPYKGGESFINHTILNLTGNPQQISSKESFRKNDYEVFVFLTGTKNHTYNFISHILNLYSAIFSLREINLLFIQSQFNSTGLYFQNSNKSFISYDTTFISRFFNLRKRIPLIK